MSFLKKFLTPVSEDVVAEEAFPKKPPEESNIYSFNTAESITDECCDAVEESVEESVVELSEIDIIQESEHDDFCMEIPEEKRFSVDTYFADKGIAWTIPEDKAVIAPVESLAFAIAINYPQTKDFVRFLRENITRKAFDFTYSLSSIPPANKGAIVSLAEKLNEYGLISNYYFNKINGTIKGTISSVPKAINFVNGDFLELYAKSVAVGVLKRMAEKFDVDYEFYHNVNITIGTKRHELDIVFRVGNHVFWGEVKSGDFDADKYRKLGIEMGVVPDRFILLAAEKTNDAAAVISYFYEYCCTNINTFKNSLIEMIEKAFEEDK